MRSDGGADLVGQRDGAGLAALGRGEDQLTADDPQLPNNVHQGLTGVEVTGRQSEHLALAQTESGPDVGRQTPPLGKPLLHGADSFERPRHDAVARPSGLLDAPCLTGIVTNELVLDRGVHDRRESVEQDRPIRPVEPPLLQPREPVTNGAGPMASTGRRSKNG
jgi:hypothetical protein